MGGTLEFVEKDHEIPQEIMGHLPVEKEPEIEEEPVIESPDSDEEEADEEAEQLEIGF
jgi:hypothetical protein